MEKSYQAHIIIANSILATVVGWLCFAVVESTFYFLILSTTII